MQAFALVRARRPELQLVVAGAPVSWATEDLAADGVPRARLRGRLGPARPLYRGAAALAYPSLFEGFGMPVAEAMASGRAPVVTSSHPSLDDAAGNAAIQ